MKKIQWKVEGMTCSLCAAAITKYLGRKGVKNVMTDFISGELSFDKDENFNEEKIIKGIRDLGYRVIKTGAELLQENYFRKIYLQRFFFCLPFAIALFLPASLSQWLQDPWIRLALCLPVYFTGMYQWGKSTWNSIRIGSPGRFTLIVSAASIAFFYSLILAIKGYEENYLLYNVTAIIITLTFPGVYLEQRFIQAAQLSTKNLIRAKNVTADLIGFDEEHKEHVFPIENSHLKTGDLIRVTGGNHVPADCRILWGEADVDESLINGEKIAVQKKAKDLLYAGSKLINGSVKAQVTAPINESSIHNMIRMIRRSQSEYSNRKRKMDKSGIIFILLVLLIAILTFIFTRISTGDISLAITRMITVMAISAPCIFGLSIPAAIAACINKGLKEGILFRDISVLNIAGKIRQAVFGKTGTLTTGVFRIMDYRVENCTDEEFKRTVFSLEKYSGHPIARSIVKEWKTKDEIRWKNVEEIKGMGIKAEDKQGNIYTAGSYKLAESSVNDDSYSVFITKNETLLGWIDIRDELRSESASVISYLHSKGIQTGLLTGDVHQKSGQLAKELKIDSVHAGQTPGQKISFISDLTARAPVMMIADGIHDAAVLEKATAGVSVTDASLIEGQTAQVLLLNNGIKKLPALFDLSQLANNVIGQNIFWAFFYNLSAIILAASGLLTPIQSIVAATFSNLVPLLNSHRILSKKLKS